MTIPVICEECGKLYHIPKAKLRRLKTDEARTKCKRCGFIITLRKADADRPDVLQEVDELEEVNDSGAATKARSGKLTEAMAQMQDSLRNSISRLRKKQ